MAGFELGRVVMTAGVNDHVAESTPFAKWTLECLRRHAQGDWGDLEEDDKRENEFSLKNGFRLLSSYKQGDGEGIWIITEADRSATTLLFPDEY